jgi:hypothetical protein
LEVNLGSHRVIRALVLSSDKNIISKSEVFTAMRRMIAS